MDDKSNDIFGAASKRNAFQHVQPTVKTFDHLTFKVGQISKLRDSFPAGRSGKAATWMLGAHIENLDKLRSVFVEQ
jgi:hypothetical protein